MLEVRRCIISDQDCFYSVNVDPIDKKKHRENGKSKKIKQHKNTQKNKLVVYCDQKQVQHSSNYTSFVMSYKIKTIQNYIRDYIKQNIVALYR